MNLPNQKQYPKQVFLKDVKYKLMFVKNLRDIGQTNPNKRTIKIRAGMSKNETFKTFIHEILHFLEFEFPVNLKHKQVYKLEEAIFALLSDNGFL